MVRSGSPRRGRRWRVYGLIVCLGLVGGLVAVLLSERRLAERRRANVRELLAIVDEDYQRCALGEVPAPAELGRRELNARVTGKLTPQRAHACAEIVANKLGPLSHLEHDDEKLGSFFVPVYVSDGLTGVGLCEHVEAQRKWANELGADVVIPDCSLELPKLEPTVTRDEQEQQQQHLRGDSVVLDVWPSRSRVDIEHPGDDHALRRTIDGSTWDVSPPLRTLDELHVAADGIHAFAYAFANSKENARYHVYDGARWHVGALVADGGFVEAFKRTSAGWTLVTGRDPPTVVRLDPEMDHVLERTPIRALAGRWGFEMGRAAMIDDAGNVALLRIAASGNAVEVESHFVPVGGKPEQPAIVKIDPHVANVATSSCRSGTTEFVTIGGVATLISTDSGRSFSEIPGGHLADSGLVECTAQHIYIASERTFTACDQARCLTQDMPLARYSGYQPHELDLETRGEQPRVFVTYDGLAVVLAPRVETGELAPISIWRWNNIMPNDPLVRIDGVWFAPRKMTPF